MQALMLLNGIIHSNRAGPELCPDFRDWSLTKGDGMLKPDLPMRALSIRQPQAEAIMRGTKKFDSRKNVTHIRGRVLIYASQTRYSDQDESTMMNHYRIRDISCDELPRGVLLGTVELYDCEERAGNRWAWKLRKPQRAKKLRKPKNQPQPVWFTPY